MIGVIRNTIRLKKDIEDIGKQLEWLKTDERYGPNLENIVKLEEIMERLINREEVYWKQRSRMEWLAHGNCTSSYFHNKALERYRKNTIVGLENNFGDWCMDPNVIIEIISDYFGEILPFFSLFG